MKNCEICGTPFEPKDKRHKYCGAKDCINKLRRMKYACAAPKKMKKTGGKQKKCVECKTEFTQITAYSRFCCDSCENRFYYKKKIANAPSAYVKVETRYQRQKKSEHTTMQKYGTKHDANIKAMKKEYDALCDKLEAMESIITPEANEIIKRVQMLENFVL